MGTSAQRQARRLLLDWDPYAIRPLRHPNPHGSCRRVRRLGFLRGGLQRHGAGKPGTGGGCIAGERTAGRPGTR
jgi:hypothetical protein